jgi:hypothetical protein
MSVLEVIKTHASKKGEKLELVQEGSKTNKDNMCWKYALPEAARMALGEAKCAVLEILNDLSVKATSVPLFEETLVDPSKLRKPEAEKSKARKSTDQVPKAERVSLDCYSALRVAQSVQ